MTSAEQSPREDRIPVGSALSDAIGRLLFRAEHAVTDYGRCVQVAQLLGDAASVADSVGDFARADLCRQYAYAVSQGGNALHVGSDLVEVNVADPWSPNRRGHDVCGGHSPTGFICTRRQDHGGRHSASNGTNIIAAWEQA